MGSPVLAAEQLYAQYSFLELSLPVAELEAYARDGTLSDTLATYADYLQPQQLQQLRAVLTTQLNLTPQTLSSLLSTPVGKVLLDRASTIIQSPSEGSSPEALHTALLAAAADPEGLTPISLMRHFPDAGIQIDLTEGIALFQSVEALMQQTEAAVTLVQQRAMTVSEAPSSEATAAHGAPLQTLKQSGSYTWDTLTFTLTDRTPKRLQLTGKARRFPVDLYIPERPEPAPVLVISHGFSADRSTYASFARHLASHGFAVAVPEHPGSSAQRVQAWLAGQIEEQPQALEFLDRPLDVTFLLDELERRSARRPKLKGRLNLEQVGIFGHSFGGYTALALGGGTLNFSTLRQDCGPQVKQTLNVSQILQCQVLELPQENYDLADARVKAVLAVSPMTRSIFGQQGLEQVKQPVMMLSASMDTVTPSLLEQIQPFTWLPNKHKYLVVIKSASHFSTSDAIPDEEIVWKLPPALVGPSPSVARGYLKVLGTAFFQTHLLGSPKTTLSAVNQLSDPSLPLSMVRQLSAQDLVPILEQLALTSSSSTIPENQLLTESRGMHLDYGTGTPKSAIVRP